MLGDDSNHRRIRLLILVVGGLLAALVAGTGLAAAFYNPPLPTTPSNSPNITNTPTSTDTPTVSPTCIPGSNYTIQTGSGTQVAGTVDIGNHCDECTTFITLPSTAHLYSSTYTNAYANSNAVLNFDSVTFASTQRCFPH